MSSLADNNDDPAKRQKFGNITWKRASELF
jgi:hypothetical protein